MRATLIGFSAVIMWSFLALFTAASGDVPPFQLSAIAFLIASLPGIAVLIARPERRRALRQPAKVWIAGIAGLFGYHFLYFTALRNAPAVDAGLIAYLWPLLIVVGSALLPGEKLKGHHIAGAIAGFAGTALLITRGGGLTISSEYALGYIAAFLCAFTWSGYSLVSRSFSKVSTDVVTGFCLATSVLSLFCHLALETTVWPQTASQWLAVAGLGLFPVGIAFYAWDYGVKKGNIQVLGAASYAAPLLSTIVLLVARFGEPGWRVIVACLLITGGAVLAARDMIVRKKA
ncbi:EamA family transporter [Martelella lutilitoris]|uniref:EamA family transporter n=1 Tax=Martelella lutilitoris TaxID=2583532 RepID=A0A7T7HKW8_9HYPH|nr:EamA family transporter [Martelella lutilitoris]QQM31073.1 EamA family transporter [Martelella lutilitoris]